MKKPPYLCNRNQKQTSLIQNYKAMKKNITEIKRNLIEHLFTVLHRDYNECTIYTPGIENIVTGANGITIKRLEN